MLPDPMVLIFTLSIALASSIIIYLIAKAGRKRKKIEEAESTLEQVGITIPREEIKKIIEEESKKEIEQQIREEAEKEAEKRLKKATRGLHKAKGQKITIWYDEQTGFGEGNVVLGKLHSYDRLSLDGIHGYYVFYYFPIHNSVFLNGIQAIVRLFGRGKRRLEVPEELILSISPKEIIIHAKTLQTIDGNTFRVIPPERIEPVVEENRFLRKAYKRLTELNTELLKDMSRAVKLGVFTNPFFRQWYLQQRMLQGVLSDEDEAQFFALEGRRLKEERIRRAYEKLQNLNARVEGGERYV
jgi:hypothetical protein